VDANAPTVLAVSFNPTSGTLIVGDTLTVSITANEASLTADSISINGVLLNSTFTDQGGGDYQVLYVINEGDTDIGQSATIPVYVVLDDSAGNASTAYTTSPAAGVSPAIDANSPVVSSVSFSPTTGIVGIGDTLTMTIQSTETGLSAATITVNTVDVASTFNDNGDNTYRVYYVVQSGDPEVAQTETIPIQVILEDAAGNRNSAYTTSPAADACPAIDSQGPSITSVSFSPTSGVLVPGSNLVMTIQASEAGLSAKEITVNNVDVKSTLSDLGGGYYSVTYVVSEGDDDIADNSTIPIRIILQDDAGNETPAYTTSPAADVSPGIDAHAPLVTNLFFTPSSGILGIGDTVTVTILADERDYTAQTLEINGQSISNLIDNDDATYTAYYVIQEGDSDIADSETIPVSVVLADSAGNLSSEYTTSPSAANTPRIDAHRPTVVSITTTTPDGYRKLGETVTLTITFSESVGSGIPLTAYLNSSGTVSFSDFSGSTVSAVYTVQEGEESSLLNVDSLSGGSVGDIAGNRADLTIPSGANLADTANIYVDGIVPQAFSTGSAVPKGEIVVSGYFNATDTAVAVGVPHDGSDLSLIHGVQKIMVQIGTGSWQDVTDTSAINSLQPDTLIVPLSNLAALPQFGDGVWLKFRAVLYDIAGNSRAGSPSEDSLYVDRTTPSQGIITQLQPVGGNVVSGIWNSTNTSLDVSVLIPNDPTLTNGTLALEAKAGAGGTWSSIGSAASISQVNTTQTVALSATDLSGFQDGDTLYFRTTLTDVAGNSTTSGTSGETLVVDYGAPAAFQVGSVTPLGTNVVPGYWNATTSGLQIRVPIDDNDPSLIGGTVQLLMAENPTGVPPTYQYEDVGSPVTITDTTDLTLTLDSNAIQGLSFFAENVTMVVSARITDKGENSTIGDPSADLVVVDRTAPADSTTGPVTVSGGTVADGYWNSTNTSLRVSVPFRIDDVSISQNGVVQIQARAGALPFENIGSPDTIRSPVSPKTVTLSKTDVEGISGFDTNVQLDFRAVITDVAGNTTIYSAANNVVKVDTSAPTAVSLTSLQATGPRSQAGSWNLTDTAVVIVVPIEADSSLLFNTGSFGTLQAELRAGTGPYTPVGQITPITQLSTTETLVISRTEVEALPGYGDGVYLAGRVRIIDAAGNETVTPVADDSLLIDISPPPNFTITDVMTQGEPSVAGMWNAQNSGVEITFDIPNENSLLGGKYKVEMKVVGYTGADYDSVAGGNITQIGTPLTVTIDSSIVEHIAGFADGYSIATRATLQDIAGNTTTSPDASVSLFIDETPPDSFAIQQILLNSTWLDVSQYWSAYDTSLTITVPIDDNDLTLIGGSLQIQARTGNNPFADLGSPDTLQSTGTDQLHFSASLVEALPGFQDDRTVDFKAILTDAAGNTTESSITNDAFTIDQTPPQLGEWLTDSTSYRGFIKQGVRLKGQWQNFSDNISRLWYYRYAVGTSPKAANTVAWRDVEPLGSTRIEDSLAVLLENQTYYLSLVAIDSAGNASDTLTTLGITADFTSPNSAPQVATYYFIEQWHADSLIHGTASDALAGIDSVYVTLQRQSDNYYWNGQAWQQAQKWLVMNPPLEQWSFGLPADSLTNRVDYLVSSVAVDSAGNRQDPPGTGTFQFVINQPPVLDSLAADSVLEDVLYTRTITATDPDVGTISGDTLVYSLLRAPAAMTIDSLTGVIQWTPGNDDVGDTLITVKVVDRHNVADSASFTLRVIPVNDPPEPVSLISPPDSTNLTPEDGVNLTFLWTKAIDVDSQTLSYFLNFQGTGYDTVITTADTSITLNVAEMNFPIGSAVKWFVQAYDQQDTSTVQDTFRLTTSAPVISVSFDTLIVQRLRYRATDTVLVISNGGLTNLVWQATNLPDWVRLSDSSGVVAYNQSQTIQMHLRTDSLKVGIYQQQFQIINNDPNQDTLGILLRVEIYDKPELAIGLYHSPAFPKSFTFLISDSLAMTDSLHFLIGVDTVALTRLDSFTYIAQRDFSIAGIQSLTVHAFGWAGDTVITRDFTVSLAKGQTWLARSVDGRFGVKLEANALAEGEALALVDSGFKKPCLGPAYAVVARSQALRQPFLVSWRDSVAGKAIYRVDAEGHFVELPTIRRNGVYLAWSETPGWFRLGDRTLEVPLTSSLTQNYPNPFNPVTNIVFDVGFMAGPGQEVEITVYNILGQQIRILSRDKFSPGRYTVTWDGKDEMGRAVPSGLYFAVLRMRNGFHQAIKMILVR